MIYGTADQPVPPFFTEYGLRRSRAEQAARNTSDDILLQFAVDEVAASITEKHAAPMISIDYDRISSSFRKPQAQPFPGPIYAQELAIYFPARGCTNAMWNRGLPISATGSGGEATLAFSYAFTTEELGVIPDTRYQELITEAVEKVRALHEKANTEISSQRDLVNRSVRSIIEPRWRSLQALRRVTSGLNIPNTPPRALEEIPLERRKLSFERLSASAAGAEPEYILSQEIAEDLINLVINFGSSLEIYLGTSDQLAEAGETTFRDMILNSLSFIYRGAVTGETFQGSGKADIVLRWRNRNAFIAECKIWDGPSKFREAIDQLLGKYVVWRDARVALILFIRDRNDITSIIESASECITSHERFIEAVQTEDPSQRRDYLISAVNDEQRRVRLSLLPVVIPRKDRRTQG